MIAATIISAALCVFAGILHGMGESRDKNAKALEIFFKAEPVSFWGSQQWLLKYKNHDVSQGYKSLLWKYWPIDFEHLEATITKGAHIAIGALAFYGLPTLWAVVFCVLAYGVMSGVTHFTYEFVNKKIN